MSDDKMVRDLAGAFWRIEGNYNREGTCTPGGRFYEKTLQSALAEFAVREVRREVGAKFAEWAMKNEIAEPPLDWAWFGEIVRWTGAR